MGGVLRRPPVRELALRVEFRARIVEAMTDLVPDRRTGGAVVSRGIRFRIEERRIQNGSRKVKSVLERKIKGVDRLRSHPPFAAIDRATELGQLVMIFPLARSPVVAKRIIAPDDEPSIIAPRIRVTDTDAQRFELGFGLFLRRGRHPA